MISLRITESALARITEEAKAAYARDEEACGYVTGPAADEMLADEAIALPNLANRYHQMDPETYPRTGRTYFLIDPLKFDRAFQAAKAGGRPVKVIFHSHLDVGAYFSETDAAAATMGGEHPTYDVLYLVTSVRQGAVDDHKLFRWDTASRSFVEAPMTIVRESASA
jgi:proteasome lid subunit RPN8/RPN11